MYQSIQLKNIRVIVRKQNFNQNFNLIVDAACPPKTNLLAKIFRWKIRLISDLFVVVQQQYLYTGMSKINWYN